MQSFLANANSSGKRNVPLWGNSLLAAVFVVPIFTALYFAAAKFGFHLAFTAEQVSVVWPPTGLAFAAVLLFGYRIWPGIALGAFLANLTMHEPVTVAFGIAAGNTLETIIGVWMLHRFADFDRSLGRLKDVRDFLVFAAMLGTAISATVGVTSLCLGGMQPWTAWRSLWQLWWIGDASGALIVAPALLAWGSRPRFSLQIGSAIEAAVLAAGLGIACAGIFAGISVAGMSGGKFIYLVFPFIIWAAIRFGQPGTSLVALVSSGIAIRAAMQNVGPFVDMPLEQRLAVLQIFVAVISVTGLFLSAAVAERMRAEEALRRSDNRKDEFLSMLAHELRNPLASISSALHIARLPDVGSEKRALASDIMERQLRQVIRLVDDLVDVARISHGKVTLQKESVMLAGAVNAALETVQPLIAERRHTVSSSLPEEPLWLDADPVRLSQIFVNLLNNAAKYTPPGGCIRLEAKADQGRAVVCVSDTGMGIPPVMLTRIFDMFMQGNDPKERSREGLGIGLTLVRNLVEMHGGDVEARSKGKNEGSEFIVRLPLMPPSKTAISSEPATGKKPPAAARKFRVLLADDNESFTETFGYSLGLLGHDVKIAHDGASALAVAGSFLPEVVLLDIGLPEMDGYEVCKKIRMIPALKHSVIIAQTGFSQPEHRERSREAGFDHHLIKPVKIALVEELFTSLTPFVPAEFQRTSPELLQTTG